MEDPTQHQGHFVQHPYAQHDMNGYAAAAAAAAAAHNGQLDPVC